MIKQLLTLLAASILTIPIADAANTFPGNAINVQISQSPPTAIQASSQSAKTEKLVHRAVAFTKQHGRVSAVCEFNQRHSSFNKGNNYIFAFVCNNGKSNGIFIADPITPSYNFTQQQDNPVISGILNAVAQQPEGIWYQYCWYDPKTNQFEKKESFIVMIPEMKLCIGSGYYFTKKRCLNPAL